jgi:hypothetical protein
VRGFLRWYFDNQNSTVVAESRGPVLRCLVVSGANAANGTRIVSEDCAAVGSFTKLHQEFRAYSDGSIRGLPDKCLTMPGGKTDNGTRIQLADCDGAPQPRQQWSFASNGTLRGLRGTCLEVRGGNQSIGTAVQMANCSGDQNSGQQWTLR